MEFRSASIPQIQPHPVYLSGRQGCSCAACGDRSLTDEGRDRAGPSSRCGVRVLQPVLHCSQERRWVTTDLGSARLESGPSQASVQDPDAEMLPHVHSPPRLVCSDQPEGHILISTYLDDWLILAKVVRSVIRTQGPGAQAPQPLGSSGQLGKD